MSQLETLMLVGLGFVAAALVALLIARSAWTAAVRLGARRGQKRQPAALLELQADRDRLRAEYAMLSRKLETRLGDLKGQLAEQLAEISRSRNRMETLVGELSDRDDTLAGRDAEILSLKDRVSALETELAERSRALEELQERARGHDEEAGRLAQAIKGLNAEIVDRDQEIAKLRTLLAEEPAEAGTGEPAVMTARDRLRKRIADLAALSRDISDQRQQLSQEREQIGAIVEASPEPPPKAAELAAQSRSIEEELAAAERESEDLANELKRLDQEWSEKLAGRPAPEPPPQGPAAPERAAGGIANVINLANRLRALKNDIAG